MGEVGWLRKEKQSVPLYFAGIKKNNAAMVELRKPLVRLVLEMEGGQKWHQIAAVIATKQVTWETNDVQAAVLNIISLLTIEKYSIYNLC